jgi:uracil-DNA glycosylase
MNTIQTKIQACCICKDRFENTKTRHAPRPVVWFSGSPRILIAGQAPGARVHETGRPFTDRSGDRLREWMGIDDPTFYDKKRISIVPMAFCFPGYDAKGSDLKPPKICADTWRKPVLEELGEVPLTLLIGGYAQNWHLGDKMTVTARVENWRAYAPDVFPLPHPSWRNTGWLKKHPWFEAELLPILRARVKEVLT